jgi:hypothetical protein
VDSIEFDVRDELAVGQRGGDQIAIRAAAALLA